MAGQTDSYVVFTSGLAEEIEQGAIVKLVARGKPGGKPVEGWYVMLQRQDGHHLLLLNSRDANVKFIKTVLGLFKMLDRMPAREVNVPLEGQVEDNKALWQLHAQLNQLVIGGKQRKAAT